MKDISFVAFYVYRLKLKNKQAVILLPRSMSTFSLPRLLNGGGLSKSSTINSKFFSLNRFKKSPPCTGVNRRPVSPTPASSSGSIRSNEERPCNGDVPSKRQTINRNGSIVKNQFRGIKKDYLESQTNLIVHSMTVSRESNQKLCVLVFVYITG